MNKPYRIILSCLFLLSFFLNFYLLITIKNSRNFFEIHQNQDIILDFINETKFTSHNLDQFAQKYIETGKEEYYNRYNSLLRQILGLLPRNDFSLYHAEIISLFSLLQNKLTKGDIKEEIFFSYEQLIIQTHFHQQAFSIFRKSATNKEYALEVLNSKAYKRSQSNLFKAYNKILNSIKHHKTERPPINLQFIFSFAGILFILTLFTGLLYLYRKQAFSKNNMSLSNYINLLVNSMPFASVIFNGNEKVIGCNNKLLELLDIKNKNDFISNFKKFIAPMQEDTSLSSFILKKNSFIKQNNIAIFNFIFQDADQNPIHCQITALYFNYQNEDYFIYYAFNSQKELEMQAKIKEQEERIQIMLNSNPLCCTIWDENYNLIDCNLEAIRLFNFKSKQEYIKNFSKINPVCQPDGQLSSDKYLYAIQKAFLTGYERFEWLHQDLNHTLIPCQVTLVRIKYKDTNIIAGYARDLRDEKKIFNKLKMKQTELIEAKLQSEKEAKAKSDFLAIMSHEIRTPLNAIINIFGFLSEINLDSKNKNFIQKGISSANILLHTINDILDYSKIEAGQLNIEHISFSLDELIQTIYSLFISQAQKKGIDLFLEKEKGLEDHWIGDPMRITQILNNLLSNAIKFTDTGSITIRVRQISDNNTIENQVNTFNEQNKIQDIINTQNTIHEEKADATINAAEVQLSQHTQTNTTTNIQNITLKNEHNWQRILRFEVFDTGIGITQQQLKRIFTPFMQADSSTTRKYGGTGLGLSISQNLAKLMNGQLKCESIAGKGSNFILEIPLTYDENAVLSNKNSSIAIDNAKISDLAVLLVEDNQINTLIATELMKKKGIIPDTAANGIEALKKAGEKHYDVILMDIQMPQMDGITTTKHLREELGLTIPIIAMTANVLEEDKQLYMHSGFTAHLGKPIIPAKLYEALTEVALQKS